jgi:uncharacterized protein
MCQIQRRNFLKRTAVLAAGVTASFTAARRTEAGDASAAAAGPRGSGGKHTALPRSALLQDGPTKTFLLVFHTGQEVMKGLLAFARQHTLVAGHLTGIGAISEAVIGYFDPQQKTYLHIQEKEQAEVLSLTGNLALHDNEPFFHVHVALGMRDGSARGGHLFEATVRPTVELVLTTYAKPVNRSLDPETGLPLLTP